MTERSFGIVQHCGKPPAASQINLASTSSFKGTGLFREYKCSIRVFRSFLQFTMQEESESFNSPCPHRLCTAVF